LMTGKLRPQKKFASRSMRNAWLRWEWEVTDDIAGKPRSVRPTRVAASE
jgi:hypothetical protein